MSRKDFIELLGAVIPTILGGGCIFLMVIMFLYVAAETRGNTPPAEVLTISDFVAKAE